MHVFFCVSKNVSVSCAYTQGKREQFSGFNRTLDAINNVFRKFSAFHDETGRLNVDGMNIIRSESGSAGMPRPISYAVFCLKKKILASVVDPCQCIERTVIKTPGSKSVTWVSHLGGSYTCALWMPSPSPDSSIDFTTVMRCIR